MTCIHHTLEKPQYEIHLFLSACNISFHVIFIITTLIVSADDLKQFLVGQHPLDCLNLSGFSMPSFLFSKATEKSVYIVKY